MMPQHAEKHDTKIRRRRGDTKYPGIVEAARVLKVNRSHIYRVLEGERRSPRVEAYFARLKKRKHFTTENAESAEGAGR